MKQYIRDILIGFCFGLLAFFVISLLGRNPIFLSAWYYLVLVVIVFSVYKALNRVSIRLTKSFIISFFFFGFGFIVPPLIWYMIVSAAFSNANFL